jgi:membrane protease YdiL (CAAX protease family)
MNTSNTEKQTDGNKTILEKYELIFYFILTFLITWSFNFIGIINIEIYYPFLVLGAFGPFLSALAIIYIKKGIMGIKEFLNKFKQARGIIWFLISVLAYIIILSIVLWITTLLGATPINPYQNIPLFSIMMEFLIILIVTTFLTGGNEEPGWRGYALPKLLEKFKPVWAGLILGFIWGFWHIPSTFLPTLQQLIPFPLYLMHVVLMSMIFTWLYLRTKGSLLFAILYHGLLNGFLGISLMFIDLTLDQFLMAIFIYVLLEAIFVVLLLILDRDKFFN